MKKYSLMIRTDQNLPRKLRALHIGSLLDVGSWSVPLFWILAWLVILVALHNQRAYQDSWVLEDTVVPVIFFIASYLIVALHEKSSAKLAVFSSVFVLVLRMIPSMKYQWAYGTAIDQAIHIASIDRIMNTGFPTPGTPYTDIPGLHGMLGLVAMVSGVSANEVAKYAFPILVSLIPLFIYLLSSLLDIKDTLRKQIVIASTVAFDPYFLVMQGSPYGVLLVTMVVVWFLARELVSPPLHIAFTIGLLVSLVSLVLGHGISSLIFTFLLGTVLVVQHCTTYLHRQKQLDFAVLSSLRILILVVVLFTTWWMFQAEGVFNIFVNQIWAFLTNAEVLKPPVPNRTFLLPPVDILVVLWSLHGNTITMALLSGIGVGLFLKYRSTFSKPTYSTFIALFALELGLILILTVQLVSGFGNLEYFRLIGYAMPICSFFVGITLWQLSNLSRVHWFMCIVVVMFLSLLQVYPYQPMLPTGDVLFTDINQQDEEPVVFLHTVVSNYQTSMLAFAQNIIVPGMKIRSDRVTQDEAYMFWGSEYFNENPISYASSVQQPLDAGSWDIFLLHKPGTAGPFSEPVEFRTKAVIQQITNNTQYSLIYDNGESIILTKK